MKSFLLTLLMLFLVNAPVLPGQSIQVSLDDVEQFAEKHSPEWEQFNHRLEFMVQGENADAVRLNPELHYDLEYLNSDPRSEREHFAFIEQELRTPSHFRNLRQYRDQRVEAINKEIKSSKSKWLADMRFGFIRIVLIKEQLSGLEQLQRLPDHFMEALELRSQEGETSLIEEQLLKMSRYQLQSLIRELELSLEQQKSEWLIRMGIDNDQHVEFVGSFSDPEITIPGKEELMVLLDQAPERQATDLARQSARQSIDLEESRRWPSFSVRAGYKTLNPDFHGFMAGVSIPIPLLNRNRPAIEQARAQERMSALTYSATVDRQNRQLNQAWDALYSIRSGLNELPEETAGTDNFINTLTVAYEEGEQSLNDVLNTLNMMADTHRTKFSQLEQAYEQVMIIEAVTGRSVLMAY
ncbi:TolC family protein [Rhodohalobacter sp. SW132]|uniref:TolC family protein n=1 Tax=Rhodohalobacter sp. SW132 TaxID=2293433 RepID=UPI000E271B00|nr:TolC family protein [Rhodohalobacter sp. SW132]REL32878.1 TolC family protein [Rhodohalobacter sp. SW132]